MNFLFLTLALTCFVSVYSADWTYKGHADWGNTFPNCKLNQQSPIKINSHTAKYYNKLGAFTLKNFDKMMEFKIKNDGHTIKLTPPQSDMTSSAGGLPSTYTVAQFHFHWSQGDKSKGSEHILDDKAYPLELHIVQVNNNYGNITEALKHSDGLAVFGFFFKEGATNKGLSKFVKKIPEVGIDSKSEMFSISQLIESEHDMDNYFRYEGSLTTPPCSQAVVWTVFNKILTADASQLADIWGVKDHDGNTISNYRPIQKLNGRVVHASFTASSEKEESKHWTYEDTISWGDDYSECSGGSQSPINIMEDDIIKDQAIGPIKFTGYRKVQQFDMINNGHSLQLNFKNEDSFIWGGNLPDKYTALQFHFHWDAENERAGSEHRINGIAYPLEMHIVHVKSSSLNIDAALKDPSGLAVLSFLFQIDDKENPEMEKFLQSISKTKDFKEEKDISLNIAELIGLDELGPYYRYKGSLTTPPCSEVVIWSVYKKPITISKRQLQVFWSLKSKKKYLHNFRPTQKMNGRDVCVSVQ